MHQRARRRLDDEHGTTASAWHRARAASAIGGAAELGDPHEECPLTSEDEGTF
jgi:hypothetical protein